MTIHVPQFLMMLMDVYPTRCAVLSELTPSDISSLRCAIPLLLSDSEKAKYCMLHREFPIYANWIESEISKGKYNAAWHYFYRVTSNLRC